MASVELVQPVEIIWLDPRKSKYSETSLEIVPRVELETL